MHGHFANLNKTAALRPILFHDALAPDIALCLDLQALLRVRRLAKESRLYDRQLEVEIEHERTLRKYRLENKERQKRDEMAQSILAEAAEFFEAHFPGASWQRLVAGDYPEARPPSFWYAFAGKRHAERVQACRFCRGVAIAFM